MSKSFKIVGEDISDGYHTFDELYEHRNLLFINLCISNSDISYWRPDTETPGWFILYWDGPGGQVSYHIKDSMLHLVQGDIRRDYDAKWDGHNSQDVIFRLRDSALKGKP